MPFNISGGIENDEDVPDLVDSPPDSDEEEDKVPWSKRPDRCPGKWMKEPCLQSNFGVQADRWMEILKDDGIEKTFRAIERLLISPFLFQQRVIPQKWVIWAKSKDMVAFDLETRKLAGGKLLRHHYLVVRMLDCGLRSLRIMTERKKPVASIMKMMFSIRNVPSTEVDQAIKETKRNEYVKVLAECISTEIRKYPSHDRVFFDTIDRVLLTVLICLRQFAEVVHIITCEGRDVHTEVRNHLTNHFYYMTDVHEKGREKGNSLYKDGKFVEAIAVYTNAIKSAPFYYLLYSNRCQALIKLKDFESAFADAYRTIILNPNWDKGYYKVVVCLGELGRHDEALAWGKHAATLFRKDEVTFKSLMDLMDQIGSEQKLARIKNAPIEVRESQTEAQMGKGKKKSKSRKKKKKQNKEDDDVPELVSDDEFDECPVIMNKLKKEEEEKRKREEQRVKMEEKEKRKKEGKEKKDKEIQEEYEHYLVKASEEFFTNHFLGACKSYKIAIDFVDKHKKIPGYNENDIATLLYTRGVSSQRQGSPSEIEISKQYFSRIINEHKIFSHLAMAYFADAKSIYLLNDFDHAMKQVSTAMLLVKSFPIHGLLTWPGSSENIPESDESYLSKEMQVLLQQCKVPPIPAAVCRYEECSNDYHRKQIYSSDIDFEGYFEVTCDWCCILNFHLKCWSKFKHDHLNVSGDRDILDTPCLTPDCDGKVNHIRMLDEHLLERKEVKRSPVVKRKEIKFKRSKYDHRTSKSEVNLKLYKEIQAEKRRKKKERDSSGGTGMTNDQESRTKNQRLQNGNIAADRDLSGATIYVKSSGVDNAQKTHGHKAHTRNHRRVAPVSLQQFCSSLPGYHKNMSMKEVDEALERVKAKGMPMLLPDDVRVEIEKFEISLSDEEAIHFTDDEKTKMPFLFEYFLYFLTNKGPLNTNDDCFVSQWKLLPDDMRSIIKKCGGLIFFLNSSPLFIQVPPYIGIHSQHEHMRRLTYDHRSNHAQHSTTSLSTPEDDLSFLELEEFGLSKFAKDFYQVGGTVGESDILNLTGGDMDSGPNDNCGEMYKLDRFPQPRRLKSSQNSETSSMYSLEDFGEAKSEGGSQVSYDIEKSFIRPVTPQKRNFSQPSQSSVIVAGIHKKQLKKKQFTTTETQTEGKDEAEKAKEAVARLQERLEEMQDDFTKLKRTSQTSEESLLKRIEEASEREKEAIKESKVTIQTYEIEIARTAQVKKQCQDKVQIAEAKMEQHQAREQDLEMNLASLTQGIQKDREIHLKEILDLRRAVETKDKQLDTYQRRAISAEIDLMRTKEAYHVGPHLQAKVHCEQGVREFDIELARLASILPDHIMNHFKLARKQWADNVITCEKTIETLKAAYASIIEQINAGRPLSELPPVPDLKPPPQGPNPRHMMLQLQRGEMVICGTPPVSGKGDGQVTGTPKPVLNGATSSPVAKPSVIQSNSSPLPPVTKKRVVSPPVVTASHTTLAPIGSELPKAPRKKNFVQLVDKLCKNLPQLTREQVEICAQQVRAENKGLTGLLYEEIETRIRDMVGLQQAQTDYALANLHSFSASASRNTGFTSSFNPFMSTGRKEPDFWDIEDEELCPICCDPLKDGKVSTLECEHKFHYDCISKWMRKQRTCPNCRKFMADTTEFPSLGYHAPPGL